MFICWQISVNEGGTIVILDSKFRSLFGYDEFDHLDNVNIFDHIPSMQLPNLCNDQQQKFLVSFLIKLTSLEMLTEHSQ